MGWQTITFADQTTEEYNDTHLDKGAEGEIFRSRDERSVVKMVSRNAALTQTAEQERIQRIKALIETYNPTKGDPFWDEFYAWPNKLVVRPRVGFRMRAIVGMQTIDHWIFPRTFNSLPPQDKGWFLGRLACMIKLASAAQRLSSTGISYPDLSHKNIMVDPFTGKATLIDCDSITIPNMLKPNVIGTKMYLAPELYVTGAPSVASDRHSLAIIIYYFLVGAHPLMGDKIHDPNDSDKDDLLRFGARALYIEHPADQSNHLATQTITAEQLGYDLAELFRRAFVVGLHVPQQRPQPHEWLQALWHTYDRVMPCAAAHCYWRSFVALPNGRFVCPACNTRLSAVQRLPYLYILPHRRTSDPEDYDDMPSLDKHYLVGWPGRSLHAWHTQADTTPPHSRTYNPRTDDPQATFLYDPRSGDWYLQNLLLPTLHYQDMQRQWHPIPPGTSMLLRPGLVMQFGPAPMHNRATVTMMNV
jgi:hypothetical protein